MLGAPIIDSHCHLDFEIFDADRSEVLLRAKDNNVSDIIIPGTEMRHWERIKQLSQKFQQLHACYGLHPYWINQHNKSDIEGLENYIDNNRPVALGECGLDFRPEQADRKTQLYFFEAQLDIAEKSKLPVVIHSVKATEQVIQIIKKYRNLNGMIHSFSGSIEQAKQLIDLNFYISISGSVTHNNAKSLKKVVKEIGLTSLLVETDAPDQPDRVNKGKRNEPAFLINTVNAISEIKEETEVIVAEQTSINAKKLFNL